VVDDEDEEATDPAAAAAAADAASLDHRAPGADAPAKLLEVARPGDCVGVGALLHPGSRWEVRVVAAAPTTVWELTAEDFESAAGAVVDDKRDRFAATVDACATFRALTQTQKLRVADALAEATFAPGETVFHQGALAPVGKDAEVDADVEVEREDAARRARPDGVFVVEKGWAVASAVAPGSRRSEVIRAYRRGDVFGAASVLDGSRRARTVTAAEAGGGARDAPGWARVALAVIAPAALDQLGFLRAVLARAEGCE
jgi:CRP-like cAMP-binding protein